MLQDPCGVSVLLAKGQTAILGCMPAPLASVTNGDNDSFVSFRELNNCLKGKKENSFAFHIQWT